ncbi:MAG: hypothetical protein U0625_01450 [Phycisphaerales bacterium]
MLRWLMPLVLLLAAALAPAAGAQSGNAAEGYRQAFQILGVGGYRGAGQSPLFTDEDWNFIGDLTLPLADGQRAHLEALLGKAAPALGLINESAKQRRCDWELDHSQGFELLLPHLSAMRSATRLLRARAMYQTDGGDEGIVETLAAIGNLGAQAGQDRILISSLVGSSVGQVLDAATADAIESGAIDQKAAAKLLEALGPLKRDDRYQYAAAVAGEFSAASASIKKASSDKELRELLGIVGDGAIAPGQEAAGITLERAQEEMRRMKPLYDSAAAAFTNPNPEAAMAEMRRIEQTIESGRAGALAKVLMPSLMKALEAKLKSDQQIALLLARLQAIADGREKREDTVNAAFLLARAAAGARSLATDTQEAIELLRVAPEGLDASTAERAMLLMERADRAILLPLADGASMKRCDFAALRKPLPSLEVSLLGGLRGAVRVALAQGLAHARAKRSPDAAASAIATGYAVAALLAQDASLARAVTGASIWRDSTAALDEVRKLGALSPERADEIDRAMVRMNAPDPFGMRKALERDAARIVDESARFSGGASKEAREARAAILRQRGATSVLARVALSTAARHGDDLLSVDDAAVLVRTSDLYTPAAVELVTKALAEAVKRYEEPRKDTVSYDDLRSLPPVPFDIPLEDQKTAFRREDPVRGVVVIEMAEFQSRAATDYLRAFDALKAARTAPAVPAPAAPATQPPPAPTGSTAAGQNRE